MSESHDIHGHDIELHVKRYRMVLGALIVLTIITVAVAEVELKIGLAITVALLIATFKGSLVGAIFMHLLQEQKPIFWLLILTIVFFAVLMLIPVWGMKDAITYVPNLS